jgi:hypothetical protein
MSADEAHRGNVLERGYRMQVADFAALLRGRHYAAVIHAPNRSDNTPSITVIAKVSTHGHHAEDFSIFTDGACVGYLNTTHLDLIFKHGNDTLLLGPHIYYERQSISAGPLYQEKQAGSDHGLHAINALAGNQVVSRAAFHQRLIQRLLETSPQTAASLERGFYLNDGPHFRAKFGLEGGIDPSAMVLLMREHLEGETHSSGHQPHPVVQLMPLAAQWETRAEGMILLTDQHSIAFKKSFNPKTKENTWVMVDSAKRKQYPLRPSRFLEMLDPRTQSILLSQTLRSERPKPGPRCVIQ